MLSFFFGDGVWQLSTNTINSCIFVSTYIITAIACLEIPSESNFNLPLFNASTYYIVIPYADHNLYKSGQNDDD